MFVACLACEVLCFGAFALLLSAISSERISGFRAKEMQNTIQEMLDFIRNGSRKERVTRVLALNYGLAIESHNNYCKETRLFIERQMESGGYQAIHTITYGDIRKNCMCPRDANPILSFAGELWTFFVGLYDDFKSATRMQIFFSFVNMVSFGLGSFLFGPILLLSKLIQIAYPWIIIGYLEYNRLLFNHNIDIFQMVMLIIYISMQLILLCLGIHVWRMHWWLWHVEAGNRFVMWKRRNKDTVMREANKWYENVCWYPAVEKIIVMQFGSDIGSVIMNYCKSFQLEI